MALFGDNLRTLRGKQPVREVASIFGVSQPTWSTWELGTREPNLDMLAKICKHFGVSSDWLLGLTIDQPNGGINAHHSVVAINGNATHNDCQNCPFIKAAATVKAEQNLD